MKLHIHILTKHAFYLPILTLKWSQELLYNLLMLSALSSALKPKKSVNWLQENMGVFMQCRLKKHLMEEKINPTQKYSYQKFSLFIIVITTCCICRHSSDSSNPQIVSTWGRVSGWVEWVRRFHKYPVILTLTGQKRITPKVCLTSEHKYCLNQQTFVPIGG